MAAEDGRTRWRRRHFRRADEPARHGKRVPFMEVNMSRSGFSGMCMMAACAAAGAAFALVVAAPAGIRDASAGGVCKGNTGDFISSDSTGKQIFVWSLSNNPPQVYAYDFESGTFTHKDLSLPAAKKDDAAAKEEKPAKEVVISGTIWTPEAAERVAIINGKTYREGDVFTTASGKKYRVVEIKPTNEVIYELVKEEGKDK